jgi:hypothetical protein
MILLGTWILIVLTLPSWPRFRDRRVFLSLAALSGVIAALFWMIETIEPLKRVMHWSSPSLETTGRSLLCLFVASACIAIVRARANQGMKSAKQINGRRREIGCKP